MQRKCGRLKKVLKPLIEKAWASQCAWSKSWQRYIWLTVNQTWIKPFKSKVQKHAHIKKEMLKLKKEPLLVMIIKVLQFFLCVSIKGSLSETTHPSLHQSSYLAQGWGDAAAHQLWRDERIVYLRAQTASLLSYFNLKLQCDWLWGKFIWRDT